MDARLLVIEGRVTKREVRLKLPTVIGRSRHADLTVNHALVSREHCRIYELDGALVVRDNDSTNGTYVEGRRIVECVLKPGDRLRVGPLTFSVVYEHQGDFPALDFTKTADHDATIEGAVPLSADTIRAEGAPAARDANPAEDTIGQGFLETIGKPNRFPSRREEQPDMGEPFPDFTADEQPGQEASEPAADEQQASAELELSAPEFHAPEMPAAEAVAETQPWFEPPPPVDDDLALPPPAMPWNDEPSESVGEPDQQPDADQPGPPAGRIIVAPGAAPGGRAKRDKQPAKPAGKGLLGWLPFGKKRKPADHTTSTPEQSTSPAPVPFEPGAEQAAVPEPDDADLSPPAATTDDEPPATSGDEGLDSFLRKLR